MAKTPTKKPTSTLADAKNAGRGALTLEHAEAREIIANAFASLGANDRDEFFSWASQIANPKVHTFSSAPKEWKDLSLNGVVGELDPASQVDWVCRVLETFLPLLSEYLFRRSSIEEHCLAGRYETAISELDGLDEACGRSFWSIDVRISILQDWKGLEAQKAFATEIQTNHPRTPVAYIVSLTSQRNEENTNLTRYVERVSSRPIPPYMKDLATYLLTKIIPSSERLGAMLNAAAAASPIDGYEALLDVLSQLQPMRRHVTDLAVERLLPLSSADWRLARLTKATFNKSHSFLLPVQPSFLPPPELIYRNAVENAEPHLLTSNKALARYAEVVRSIWENGEATVSALVAHEKNIVNHRNMSMFYILSGFYALDRLHLRNNSVFHITQIAHSLPGTSELGDALNDGAGGNDKCFPGNPWSAEVVWTVMLLVGAVTEEFVRSIPEYSDIDNSLWRLRFARLIALTKAQAGVFVDALHIVALACCGARNRGYIFPLEQLMPGQRWADISEAKDRIELPIFLSLLHQVSAQDAVEKLLRVAFREFLHHAGVDRPSQMSGLLAMYPPAKVSYLLREIALTNALDALSALKNTRALDEERIAIYQTLIELDPESASSYINEIKQLTKLISLADGLSDIDGSRVHVEYEPLFRSAEELYGETFRRYAELRKASVGFGSAEEFDKALTESLRADAHAFEKFLEYPEQEGDALLIDIVRGIVDLFLADPVHGLDVYLSMRIRHGSLATNIRGPLEARGLHIPEKQTGVKSELLEGLLSAEATMATSLLKEFTRRFEKAISSLLKERIQIRTGAGGNGLFDFSKLQLLISSARSRVEPGSTFRSLFDHVFETLAIYLSVNLKTVRTYIDSDFRHEVERCFDWLRVNVEKVHLPVAHARIVNAIGQASPEVSATISRIERWFEVGGVPSGQQRTFEEIVDIALLAVQRAHRKFSPHVCKKIEDIGPQSLTTFNETLDALFPLLENIAEHSGVDSPKVDITVQSAGYYSEDGRLIEIRVESDVSPTTDFVKVEKDLENIRGLMKTGEYKRRVTSEGGTGFLKIHRMVAQNDHQNFDFGFTPDRRFCVKFSMAVLFLSEEKSKELGLI